MKISIDIQNIYIKDKLHKNNKKDKKKYIYQECCSKIE